MINTETLAIDLVLRLHKAYNGKGEALERRGKEIPQLISQVGLSNALVFYLSKAKEETYTLVYKYLSSDKEKDPEPKVRDEIRKEAQSEGGGYSVILALVNTALSKIVKGRVSECVDLSNFRDTASCLKKLREEKLELVAEAKLMNFLTVARRLLEAFYGG